MKSRTNNKYELTDFSKLSNEEMAEALVFPSKEPLTVKEKQEEEVFWQERRKQFANRTPQQQIFDKLLQFVMLVALDGRHNISAVTTSEQAGLH